MRPILINEAELPYLRDADGLPTAGDGPQKDISRFREKRIQAVLAGAWDITIEGAIVEGAWSTIQANVTAGNTLLSVADFWRFIRIVTNVAGAAVDYDVELGGYEVGAWE